MYLVACHQKTFKREVEVENWIKKYDEEMGEKQVRDVSGISTQEAYIHEHAVELITYKGSWGLASQ